MVYRKVCTEGSGTAKAGTDEQEPDKRHGRPDEVAHHTDVRPPVRGKCLSCRSGSDWPKEHVLTGGGPAERREVSRGHSSCWKRANIDKWRTHRHNEGPNVKLSQMLQRGTYQLCIKRDRETNNER